MKKPRDKSAFLHRYIDHLWRCYRTIQEVNEHVDKIMTKLYAH